MLKWITICGVVSTLFAGSCEAEIDSFLLFGDSYFDTGAGNALAESLSVPPPNPSPPYFDGRHSNGPIWIDYVSQLMGIPNTDFAVSGSETGTGNQFNSVLGGLFQQIQRYESSNSSISKDTLTIIDGGGNDFFSLLSNPSQLTPAGIAAQILQSVTNLQFVLAQVQGLGAEKTILWNLGNMGMLPLFTDPALGLTFLGPVYSQISLAYDQALLQLVSGFNQLNQFNHTHQQVFLFDAFYVFNQVAKKLAADGVNLTEHTLTTLPNGTIIRTGPPPEHLAFYDQVHPTTLTWSIFANGIAAFIDDIINGPRFVASELDVAFRSTNGFRDLMNNHYRTLEVQRYICPGKCKSCGCDDCCCDNCCCEADRFQLYFEGEGTWGETRTRGGTFGTNYDEQIVTLGIDYQWNDNLTVGTSFSAQRTNAHVKHGRGKINLHDYVPAVYVFWSLCDFFVECDTSYHYHDFHKIRRHIPFLDWTARANTTGWSGMNNLQFGYVYQCGAFTGVPIAGFGYEHLHINGYKERNAGFLNFRVTRQNQQSFVGKIGGQVFWNWNECGCQLLPFAELFYKHEFLQNRRNIHAKLFNSRDNSVIYNAIGHTDRDALSYSFGLYAELMDNLSGNISYLGETNFKECSNSIRAELNISF